MNCEMEYAELTAQVEFCKNLVERSTLYRKLVLALEKNPAIKNCITFLMGPHRRIPMVVYKLGSIQYSWASKFRLAFALLLRQRFHLWIEGIEINEPTINFTEYRRIKNYACNVSLRNDRCSRTVERPTLFFMPNPDRTMYENLLAANWCPLRLNRIMTIGISLEYMLQKLNSESAVGEELRRRTRHLKAIKSHVQEFAICKEIDGLYHDELLMNIGENFEMDNGNNEREDGDDEEEEDSDDEYSESETESESDELKVFPFETNPPCPVFATHFFGLDPSTNMEALFPGVSSGVSSAGAPRPDYISNLRPDDANWYFDPDVTSMEGMSLREALRLKEEIRMTMEELRESEPYIEFRATLMDNREVRNNIARVLGSFDNIKMVIYGIGSIEWEDESQYQLALALLLREDSCLPIGDIEVFDPVMSPTEMKACSALGCQVLLVNEECRRRAVQPTLFFVPGLYVDLIANLIEANLHPFRLNQMILIDLTGKTEMDEIEDRIRGGENGMLLPRATDEEERSRFRWVAQTYMGQEIEILCTSGMPSRFLDLYLNFFRAETNENLKTFVPRVSLRKKLFLDYYRDDSTNDICLAARATILRHCANREYPICCRYAWHPPYSGWIKLNFDGFTDRVGGPAGFGGAFHDEHGRLILMYAGPFEHADRRMASVEALRQGLRCLRRFPALPRLMIESEARGTIRWAKCTFAPPQSAAEAFAEIHAILSQVQHRMGLVYKEANQVAREAARRGAGIPRPLVWVLPGGPLDD